uniref:Ig-like domain-containing protein n=1 Tax=Scleropages formosus TaxID=113540 RepID=A0A8C9WAT9_SCLFO
MDCGRKPEHLVETHTNMKRTCKFHTDGAEFEPAAPPCSAVSVWSGSAQLLVGERVTLSCSVPADDSHGWRFRWFRDGLPLRSFASAEERYSVAPAFPRHSGRYTCLGEKDVDDGSAPPLCFSSVGGWAVVQLPPQPIFIGENVTLTCHVWANPTLLEVTFYKDGRELQRDRNPKLLLIAVLLARNPVFLHVPDILTKPQLAVLSGTPTLQGQTLVLECQTELNIPKKGLHMRYQYFRDGQRLGIATSKSRYMVHHIGPQDAGQYQCKVTVSGLDLKKWSDQVHVPVLDGECP